MFSLKKVSVILCVLALVACGKTKSSSSVKAPAAPDKTVSQQQETTPQSPSDSSKDQTDTKKQDDAKAKTPDTTTPTTPVKAKDPVVVDKPVDFSPKVTGLGSASIKPEDLMNQGYNGAILRATFCSITGKFNNDGSRCFLVYSDGTTEYQSPENREKIQAYIEQLKAEKAAQDGKTSTKADKKKKN
jgi:hypothetical protein